MKVIVLAVIWSALAVYSLLCIWTPGLRPYHRGTEKRFGLFATLAFAIFFWFPLLVLVGLAAGVIGDESLPTMWVIFCLCLLVAFVGSWIEFYSD